MNAQAQLAADGAPCAIVLAVTTEAERIATLQVLAAALGEYVGPQPRTAAQLRADILDVLQTLVPAALQRASNMIYVSPSRWQKGILA
jgi:hypothetical protein